MNENNIVSREGKLWVGNKRYVRAEISISGKRKEIHISKDVVRLLGVPSFLCLKVNKKMDSIAIMPCSGKEYISFKVPEGILLNKNVSMRVESHMFIDRIMAANGLNGSHTYQATGKYSERHNAVIFNMEDMRLYGCEGNR